MIFLVLILLVLISNSIQVLQINCTNHESSYTYTTCRDYILTYLQCYTGNIQSIPEQQGYPQQGYNLQQIPSAPFYYDDDHAYIQNSGGLKVYMASELVDMIDIDTDTGLVYININIDIYWNDYRLAWNQSLTQGLSYIYINSNYIWVPDITLYNQADGSTILDAPVILSSNGNAWLSRQAYLIYNCNLNLEKFPFDIQY